MYFAQMDNPLIPEIGTEALAGAAPVDFFVAGVQKSGTTALAGLLNEHPEIEICRIKETHHFDNEAVDWSKPDHDGLHRHFDLQKSRRLRGDATPIYTYWPNALERIKEYNPTAKIIIALRHPAMRAYSHWRMETTRGSETLSFSEAISDLGRQRVSASPGGVHRVFSYVERGFYAPQIKRVLALFPRAHVHFLRSDMLWLKPHETLSGVEEFLKVPAHFSPNMVAQYIVPLVNEAQSEMGECARTNLGDLYASDILQTAVLTEIGLTDWLSPSYDEPMRG